MQHRRPPARLLDRYLHHLSPAFRQYPVVKRASRRFGSLARRGIETVPHLIAAYPSLAKRDREFAVWALGILGDRRAVPLLIRIYRSESGLRGAAATALGSLGGERAYHFAVRNLRAVLASERVLEEDLKDAVIAVVCMPSEYERMLDDSEDPVLLLIDLVRRRDLVAWARGEAASCLGDILEDSDRRRRRWRRASEALLDALADDEPYVRHEAAHAVGHMRLQAARPRLTAMMKRDIGKGDWGSVARAARAALYAIEHGDWPAWWWEKREPDCG